MSLPVSDQGNLGGRMLELIESRRSIRKYTAEDVSDSQVRVLLDAAMAAPTAHGLEPWHFVVVRDEDTRAALAETHVYSKMIAAAPVTIAVCADSTRSLHWLEDACVAAENVLLAATALGLGAVWVAVYPHEEHEVFVRGVLDIPDSVRVVCMIPLGHPAEAKRPRSKYDPRKVHFERFGACTDSGDEWKEGEP